MAEIDSANDENASSNNTNQNDDDYNSLLKKFQQEECEQRKLFEKKLSEKRLMLMQMIVKEDLNKIKAKCEAESFRQKKNIDDEVEKLIKSIREQFQLQEQQMRDDLQTKIKQMMENRKEKLEQDKKRLQLILDNEIETKHKLLDAEIDRLKKLSSNYKQVLIDNRDYLKKIMIDFKNYPNTKILADEIGLKQYQIVLNKQSIWASKTCIIYRGQYKQCSCYVKIVILNDRSLDYKKHIHQSTKIRQYLSKTNDQQQTLLKKHEAFVKIYDIFITDLKVYTFLDECDSQNLLQRSRKGFLSLNELRKHSYTLLSCLEFMHQNAFAHLKIRGESVIFDSNNNVKLVGFGNCAKYFDADTEKYMKLSPYQQKHRLYDNHFPPEVFVDQFDPQPVDVYSFGLLIYMMTNFISNKKFLNDDWKQWTIIKLDTINDDKTRKLIEITTFIDPMKRCKLFDIRNLPYFQA